MDAHDPPAAPDDGDAVDHLWNAAHELLRAMRTLVDAADEFVESQRESRPARDTHEPREGRVHHIDIDARPASGARFDTDTDAGADAS
jgi:hypothetical protein